MSFLASGINPEVLIWARERAGYSIEDVAKAFGKDVGVVESWESSDSDVVPTYVQLEKLAYSIYKRPLALFFFPAPPDEIEPRQSFRTLPDFEIDKLTPDTRHAIRQARAMQIALSELNEGLNPAPSKVFRDIQPDPDASIDDLTSQVREYLSVDLEQQINWKTSDDAFKLWRDTVQRVGIFVFKRSFKEEGISGFCLIDDEFPVIYINNSTATTRQIFTVFHELSHILLRTNGITKQDDNYLAYLSGYDKAVEVFCNRFAAEFLVPSADFEHQSSRRRIWDDQAVSSLADRYKVSREVILRKLLDRGLVDREYYENKANEWSGKPAKRGTGGNYYYNQINYFGDRFLELAFGRYYQGRCTLERLSDYLNMSAKNIITLEHHFQGRGSAG